MRCYGKIVNYKKVLTHAHTNITDDADSYIRPLGGDATEFVHRCVVTPIPHPSNPREGDCIAVSSPREATKSTCGVSLVL